MWADLLLQLRKLGLDTERRVQLVHTLSDYLHLSPASVKLLAYRNGSTLLRENTTVLALGDAEHWDEEALLELLWPVGCEDLDQLTDLTQVLEHSVRTGHLATLLGTPVLGWRVLGNRYTSRTKRSPRHQRPTPTPTLNRPPPTRLADMLDYHTSFRVTTTRDILKPSLLLQTTTVLISTSSIKLTYTPRTPSFDMISHTQAYRQTKVQQLISSEQVDAIPHLFKSTQPSIIQNLSSEFSYLEPTKTIQPSHLPMTETIYTDNFKKSLDVSGIKHLQISSSLSILEQVPENLFYGNQDLISHHPLKHSLKVKITLIHTSVSSPSDKFTALWESSSSLFPTESGISQSLAPLVTSEVQNPVELSEISVSKENLKLPKWTNLTTISSVLTTPYLSTPVHETYVDQDSVLASAGVTRLYLSTNSEIINQENLTSSHVGTTSTKAIDTMGVERTSTDPAGSRAGFTLDNTRSQFQTASPWTMLNDSWSVLEPSQPQHSLYIESIMLEREPMMSEEQVSQQHSDLSSKGMTREGIVHSTSPDDYNQDIAILPTPTIATSHEHENEPKKLISLLSSLLTESPSIVDHVHSQVSHHVVYPSMLLTVYPLNVLSSAVSPGLMEISSISSELVSITPTSIISPTPTPTHIHDLHNFELNTISMYQSESFTELPTTMPVSRLPKTPSIISSSSYLAEQQVSRTSVVFMSPVVMDLSSLWMGDRPSQNRISVNQASDTTGM